MTVLSLGSSLTVLSPRGVSAMHAIFVGSGGVGRTQLALALDVEGCDARMRVPVYTAQDLVESLVQALFMGDVGTAYRHLDWLDLLIIDEFASLSFTTEIAQLFFHVLCRHSNHMFAILTTNRPFESWCGLFPSPVLATALLGRLLAHSFVFSINGDTPRLHSHRSDGERGSASCGDR